MTARKEILEQFSGTFDIIAVAASAGGPKQIIEVFSGLPENIPASLVGDKN